MCIYKPIAQYLYLNGYAFFTDTCLLPPAQNGDLVLKLLASHENSMKILKKKLDAERQFNEVGEIVVATETVPTQINFLWSYSILPLILEE